MPISAQIYPTSVFQIYFVSERLSNYGHIMVEYNACLTYIIWNPPTSSLDPTPSNK